MVSILWRLTPWDNNIFRIRLVDIDCFEGAKSNRAIWQSQKFNISLNDIIKGGNLAGSILEQKLKDKEVYFEFRGIDKYNRALGVLYVDNRNINQDMLETKYCNLYKK